MPVATQGIPAHRIIWLAANATPATITVASPITILRIFFLLPCVGPAEADSFPAYRHPNARGNTGQAQPLRSPSYPYSPECVEG